MAANRVLVLQRQLLALDGYQRKRNGDNMQVRATSASEEVDSDGENHTISEMYGSEDIEFAEIVATRAVKASIKFKISVAEPGDGQHMWRLCKEVGMDENSPYLYNLFCIHYAETCFIAFNEKTGSAVGYMLGFIPPTRPDTYFVWQIGASKATQGSGLARQMLDKAVAHCGAIYVEASVTPSNMASNKFFRKFARSRGVAWTLDEQWMPEKDFPRVSANHEREALYRIGPLSERAFPSLLSRTANFAHGSMARTSAVPCILNLNARKEMVAPSNQMVEARFAAAEVAKKADQELRAREVALARETAEEQRLACEGFEAAKKKADQELRLREVALAAEKAQEQRLASEAFEAANKKADQDLRAREVALAAEKAKEQRFACEAFEEAKQVAKKADQELRAREVALAAEKAEEQRLAREAFEAAKRAEQAPVFGEYRDIEIRLAVPGDGASMWQLCKDVGMDENSPYLYNLFCIEYTDTCFVAIDQISQQPVGYMLGFIPPTHPDTYFVWQIGALPSMRGSGLVQHFVEKAVSHCGVTYVEASVTPSNIASNKFFQKFAKCHGATWALDDQWMPAEDFPKGGMSHEREALYRIGPLGIAR